MYVIIILICVCNNNMYEIIICVILCNIINNINIINNVICE